MEELYPVRILAGSRGRSPWPWRGMARAARGGPARPRRPRRKPPPQRASMPLRVATISEVSQMFTRISSAFSPFAQTILKS